MSVLLIVSDVDGETPAGSRLIRSLHAQTDAGWTLERDGNEPLATIQVSADSTLRPDAVAAIRQAFVDDAAIQAVIGDAIVDGERRLRPAWSPTFISRHAHELDLVAVRGAASSGSMAARLDALAALDPAAVAHLPRPLLERVSAEAVDDARRAAARLVTERRREPAVDAASFLVPTAGTRHPDGSRLVEHAIRAARGSGVSTVEVVLIVGDEFDGDPAELEAPDVRVVRRPGPWNFSTAINTGLLAASHDTVVLLNDDIEMITEGWLRPLIEHLRDRDVSLVGAALLYPDHSLQHIGVVIDDALPLHPHVGVELERLPPRFRHAREVAAVTAACAVGRRSDLLAVGGLNEALPANFNDVDLCFKLQRTVGRIIVDPTSPLLHHESASRVPVIESWEWEAFVGRWGEIVDPWYHPGHHRPDDPNDRRRNADHLPPDDPHGTWPSRTPTIQPSVHRARIAAPAADATGE